MNPPSYFALQGQRRTYSRQLIKTSQVGHHSEAKRTPELHSVVEPSQTVAAAGVSTNCNNPQIIYFFAEFAFSLAFHCKLVRMKNRRTPMSSQGAWTTRTARSCNTLQAVHASRRIRPLPFSDLENMRRQLQAEQLMDQEWEAPEQFLNSLSYRFKSKLNLPKKELKLNVSAETKYLASDQFFLQINKRLSIRVCYLNLVKLLEESGDLKIRFKQLIQSNRMDMVKQQVSKIYNNLRYRLDNFRFKKGILDDAAAIEQISNMLKEDIFKVKQNLTFNFPINSENATQKLESLFKALADTEARIKHKRICSRPSFETESSRQMERLVPERLPRNDKETLKRLVKDIIQNGVKNRKPQRDKGHKMSRGLRVFQTQKQRIESEINNTMRKVIEENAYLPDGLSTYFQLFIKHNYPVQRQFLNFLEKSTINFIEKKARANLELEQLASSQEKKDMYRQFKVGELQEKHLHSLHQFYLRTMNRKVIELNLYAAYGNAKRGFDMRKQFFAKSAPPQSKH